VPSATYGVKAFGASGAGRGGGVVLAMAGMVTQDAAGQAQRLYGPCGFALS
jgi:hypothetical protein